MEASSGETGGSPSFEPTCFLDTFLAPSLTICASQGAKQGPARNDGEFPAKEIIRTGGKKIARFGPLKKGGASYYNKVSESINTILTEVLKPGENNNRVLY